MNYESLLSFANQQGIQTYEKQMPQRIKGLYADRTIVINKAQSTISKACTIAEEIGHYHTSVGNILNQSDLRNRKQEQRARQWAYHCMIPVDRIVQAHLARVTGRYDLAEFLNVTEEFLQSAIDRFTSKYGLHLKVNERYTISFDPLAVIESI